MQKRNNKVADDWSSGARKLQVIGQHGTIVSQMIDDQIINGSMINILSFFKFILLQ